MSKDNIQAYGQLCSLFYDATEKYASTREVDFFASFIENCPGRVLEPMSGSGRLQIPLALLGYTVDGVDHSAAMLDRCRQRSVGLSIELELYRQSLEDFCLPHTYNTVIIAVGSLQLIVDEAVVLRSLKNINRHMVAGGNLLIDIFVPDPSMDDFSVSMVRLDEHRVIRLTRRHVFNVAIKLASTFCLYELMTDGIVCQRENELIEVVWRSDHEWQELLSKAGFELVKIYDEIFKNPEPSRVIHARSMAK